MLREEKKTLRKAAVSAGPGLMRELGIEGVSRRRGRKRTTVKAAEAAKAAPDLLERRFCAARPDPVWVADITYIPTHEGWLFLAAVVDLVWVPTRTHGCANHSGHHPPTSP